MAEVMLKRPGVVAIIGELVPAGVPEHVRVYRDASGAAQAGPSTLARAHDVVALVAKYRLNGRGKGDGCGDTSRHNPDRRLMEMPTRLRSKMARDTHDYTKWKMFLRSQSRCSLFRG
jgi:hypothetical protein